MANKIMRNGVEVVWVHLAQDEKPRLLNADMARRVNEDGTLTCHRCDKHLPPTTEKRDRNMSILWRHGDMACYYNDEERYGR